MVSPFNNYIQDRDKISRLLKKIEFDSKTIATAGRAAGACLSQPLARAAGQILDSVSKFSMCSTGHECLSSHLARRTPSTGDVLQSFWYKVPSSAVTENLKGRKLKQLSATWAMCAGHGGLARGQVGRENFPNPKC